MSKPDPDRWAAALARWPLLLGAAVCFVSAVALAPDSEDQALSFGLVILGAVLLGGWVALYAAGLAGRKPDRWDADPD